MSTSSIFFIEFLVFFGAIFLFGWWQLRLLDKEEAKEKARVERNNADQKQEDA